MSTDYLITGTGSRVGKTVVGCALGFAFRARGLRVGVMKPVEVDATDARALALASGCDLPIELICPCRYRLAPSPGEPTPEAELGKINDCFGQISAASDIVLMESAGGLSQRLNRDTDFADLAAALGLEAVVVIANRPGGIDAALDTLGYATNRGLTVAGWILNDAEPVSGPDAPRVALSLCERTELPCLGTMRFKEPLGIDAVERLLARRKR